MTAVYAQVKDEPKSVVAPTTTLVSFRKPDGLILSTGNLYFTSHDAAGATVWRTAQSSIPGQEGVLYWEPGAIFGDIVFAQVDGSCPGFAGACGAIFGSDWGRRSFNAELSTIMKIVELVKMEADLR